MSGIGSLQLVAIVLMGLPFCYVFFYLAAMLLGWMGWTRILAQGYFTLSPLYFSGIIYSETLRSVLGLEVRGFDAFDEAVRGVPFYMHLVGYYAIALLFCWPAWMFHKWLKKPAETEEARLERLDREERADRGLPPRRKKAKTQSTGTKDAGL